MRRQAGVLARHLQHPADLPVVSSDTARSPYPDARGSCIHRSWSASEARAPRPPAARFTTFRCPFCALMWRQLDPVSLVSISSSRPDLQQRVHHLQMPVLRTDVEAAESTVRGQHQQLAPPGLQQRVHHLQMPALRTNPEATDSVVRGQHHQLAPPASNRASPPPRAPPSRREKGMTAPR